MDQSRSRCIVSVVAATFFAAVGGAVLGFWLHSYLGIQHQKFERQRERFAREDLLRQLGDQSENNGSVVLYDTYGTDGLLFALHDRPNIVTLYLDVTDVSEEGVGYLHGLPNLTQLSLLGGVAFDDAALVRLAGHKTLETLSIRTRQVTSRGLESLASLPRLRVLTIDRAGKGEDRTPVAALEKVLQGPSLRTLNLIGFRLNPQEVSKLKKEGVIVTVQD